MASLPITREWLATTQALGGVTLTYDDGRPFEQSLFDNAIADALATFEDLTRITVMPTEVVDEKFDVRPGMREEFLPIRLRRRPLAPSSTPELTFYLGQSKILSVPPQWVQIASRDAAFLRVLPISGPATSLAIVGGVTGWWPWTWRGSVPDYIHATYTAGFDTGDLSLLHDAVRDLTTVYERGEQGISYTPSGEPVGLGHRRATQGSPAIHGAEDTANSLAAHGGSARYLGSGDDAEGLSALLTQANAIRAAYGGHRVLTAGGVHGAADTANEVTVAAASDLDGLVALINELQVVLADHLATGSPVHGQADQVRKVRSGPVRSDYVALPGDIRNAIGCLAGIHALNVAGDLVAGAGVASKSTSIDALSQSIGTTASAMYSGYSARIGVLKKDLARLLPAIMRRYQGVMFEA